MLSVFRGGGTFNFKYIAQRHMMAYGAKTHTSGGGPLETFGKMSHNPLIHKQEK